MNLLSCDDSFALTLELGQAFGELTRLDLLSLVHILDFCAHPRFGLDPLDSQCAHARDLLLRAALSPRRRIPSDPDLLGRAADD